MKAWKKYERFVDLMSEGMGRLGWMIVLYSMVFGLTDVFLRYVLNQPSLWIGVTVQYAMVLLACVAGAYALNLDAFVKLDLFYVRFSPRLKAICDILTFFFTALYLYVLITKGMQAALHAIAIKQVTPTAIPIPIYHLKTFIPITAVFVLFVALKKFGQDVQVLLGMEVERPVEE